ncbi:unannotated protein [freshwater metagenome]|uniref:Unannotated protein n=1 Tax=freshwater metagenome TaxID=449393 RepID=A0A6J7RTH9_9ZZZZ
MVGELAVGQPVVPEVGREGEAAISLVEAGGRLVFGPAQCDEGRVAFVQRCAGAGAATFEAEAQVGCQC